MKLKNQNKKKYATIKESGLTAKCPLRWAFLFWPTAQIYKGFISKSGAVRLTCVVFPISVPGKGTGYPAVSVFKKHNQPQEIFRAPVFSIT